MQTKKTLTAVSESFMKNLHDRWKGGARSFTPTRRSVCWLEVIYSILKKLLVVSFCWALVAEAQATRTAIYVDPFRGTISVEQGRVVPPLYEATFQIATKDLGSWKPMPLRRFVGEEIRQQEVPQLQKNECIRFWTDEYIGLGPYADDFEFGFMISRCLERYPSHIATRNYILVKLPPQALLLLAWADATGQPQWAVRRATVQQVGQLKVLCIVRSVFAVHLYPTGGKFIMDIWVGIFPADVDLIFQAARYPMWP